MESEIEEFRFQFSADLALGTSPFDIFHGEGQVLLSDKVMHFLEIPGWQDAAWSSFRDIEHVARHARERASAEMFSEPGL